MTDQPRTTDASGVPHDRQDADLDTLLASLPIKDRRCFERQLQARDTSPIPDLAERWKRLAFALLGHAPAFAKFTGTHTIQFFIPDGKYRKQVFALNTQTEGEIAIVLPDVLQAPSVQALFAPRQDMDDDTLHRLVDGNSTLTITPLDGRSINPQGYYKDMVGWNRKAICISLLPDTTDAHLDAVEQLAAVAATTLPRPVLATA